MRNNIITHRIFALFALLLLAPFAGCAFTAPLNQPEVPILDPNLVRHPRASLHDFSDLVEAPAGQHGFLQSRGEHFTWEDGTRARFWGINVANTSLQESDAEIEAMVKSFRQAGFNLIRLHHFDERGGIIDLNAADSRRLVPGRLKKLDYWIYQAKQNGLYIYLDLLDYRRFKEGDGVPNAEAIGRAARPYNVFDPRLIELQKEYARKLLREHVNSYTGLAYADDPVVVMLEIYDESGLFMKRGVWRDMPEPYNTNFRRMWNEWLREKYGDTSTLAQAWTPPNGVSALSARESLEAGTIELPAMTWTPQQLPEAERFYAALPRRNDGARFAHDVHVGHFREMKEYLQRDLGFKAPLSVTGRFEDLADLKGIGQELDFIASNFYYDHPYWGTGKPMWQPPSYYHNANPISHVDERSLAASLSLARVRGKPFVVREWNYCWPNTNRGAGILEAAAYAALHDVDAMILFTYETAPTPRVSYFNVRSDPARWGLCGMAAQIFLQGLVAPARNRVVVPYNDVDVFTYERYHQPLYALGWTTRVENDFFEGSEYSAGDDVDLIVRPGRSALGIYSGAPALLWTRSLARDLAGRTLGVPQYLGEYNLTPRGAANINFLYDGVLYANGARQSGSTGLGLPVGSLDNEARLIGLDRQLNIANGFVDEKQKRLVFGDLTRDEVLRASLDALKMFQGAPSTHAAADRHVYRSDTGELTRDATNARLMVSTPRAQALAGDFGGGLGGSAAGLGARNLRGGTLVATSLDGEPLVRSRRFVIKMVTDARNVDEKVARDPRFLKNPQGQWMMNVFGGGPVTTDGRPLNPPLQVSLGGRPLLDVHMAGGSWELLVEDGKWQFFCDTPGIRFAFHRGSLGAVGQDVDARFWSVGVDGQAQEMQPYATAATFAARFPAKTALVRVG